MPSTLEGFEPKAGGESDTPTFAAFYYDGKTAQRHSVSVRLHATALDVVATDGGHIVDQWLYDAVELSDQGSAGARVIKRGSEARLVIKDTGAFAQLKTRAPNLVSQRHRTLRNMGLSVAVTVAVIAVSYFSLPLLSGAIVQVIPLETEARLGDAYADEIADIFSGGSEARLCETNAGRAALDAMVAQLARYTHGPFPYRVDILDTNMVNAVALPGGRILLLRGVLDKADSFDEVAGVLAHEMEHVNHRHGMEAMVRTFGVDILADMMFGGNFMGNVSRLMMMTSYSRDAERAADDGAIVTLRGAEIGTAGMARFFARMKEQEDESAFSLPGLLSTHPPSAAREALAQNAVTDHGWSLSAADWAALKTICE